MVANSLIDLLLRLGEDVIVVDSDRSNPDVYTTYKSQAECSCVTQKLEDEDDAVEFSEIVEQHADSHLILNVPAGDKFNVCVQNISDVCIDLKRELITLFVIGSDYYSVQQLADYCECYGTSQVFVVVNSHFGDESKFDIYHNSNVKKTVETITFPKLAGAVASKIRNNFLSFSMGMEDKNILNAGARQFLFRYRENVKNCFSPMLSALGFKIGDDA